MRAQIQCDCGKLQGEADVSKTWNKRIVCLCNDCQAFAHYLGRVDDVLDRNGGTEIIPVHPAHVRITTGKEQLQCVRLSDDGIYRWYTECCKSPIANTPSGKIPYAGVFARAMCVDGDRERLKQALGPIFARINAKYGIPPLPKDAHLNASLKLMVQVIAFIAKGLALGLRAPSSFMDPKTGRALIKPKVQTDSEYYALIDRCCKVGGKAAN